MKKKPMAIRKVPSSTGAFSKIIEVLVPTRFYWNEDGGFDGIEVGPFRRTITNYQRRLMYQVLDAVAGRLEMPRDAKTKRGKTPIPDYLLRAFKEDKITDGGDDNVAKVG